MRANSRKWLLNNYPLLPTVALVGSVILSFIVGGCTGRPTSTSTPAPLSPPELIAPENGSTIERDSPELEWQSAPLPEGYAFVVRLRHVDSGHIVDSPELNVRQWTPQLPADKQGQWRWAVQIVQEATPVSTSDEWDFQWVPGGSPQPTQLPYPPPAQPSPQLPYPPPAQSNPPAQLPYPEP